MSALPPALASALNSMTSLNHTHYLPATLPRMAWLETGAPTLTAEPQPDTQSVVLQWVPHVTLLTATPSAREVQETQAAGATP